MPIEAKSVDEKTAAVLNDAMLQALHEIGEYTVLGKSDIEKLIGFQGMRQLLGCSDVNCSAAVGNTVGADFLLTASIGEAAQTALVTVRILDVKKVQIIASEQERAQAENVNWVQLVRRATYALFKRLPPEDLIVQEAEREKQQASEEQRADAAKRRDDVYQHQRRVWAAKMGTMFGLAAVSGAAAAVLILVLRPTEASIAAGSYQAYLASPPSQSALKYQAVSDDVRKSNIILGAGIGTAVLAGVFAAVGIGIAANAPEKPALSMMPAVTISPEGAFAVLSGHFQ
jgi:hypothetical protein